MKNYKTIKEELKKRQEKTTYFTKEFYTDFLAAVNKWEENFKNNIDDSYYNGIVRLYHSYDKIYNSKFYNLNSCGYCQSLEIYNQ